MSATQPGPPYSSASNDAPHPTPPPRACCQVARAFNGAYGLGLTTRGEMQYGYDGERMTPSQCGKMDQAVAFGKVRCCGCAVLCSGAGCGYVGWSQESGGMG